MSGRQRFFFDCVKGPYEGIDAIILHGGEWNRPAPEFDRVMELCQVLHKFKDLKSLYLGKLGIHDESTSRICNVIPHCGSLVRLDLSYNPISDKGVQCILRMLPYLHTSMKRIWLYRSDVCDEIFVDTLQGCTAWRLEVKETTKYTLVRKAEHCNHCRQVIRFGICGSLCYLNVLISVIKQINPIVDLLSEIKGEVGQELRRLFNQMDSGQLRKDTYAEKLCGLLGFESYRQQDAQEAFLKLINCLEKEVEPDPARIGRFKEAFKGLSTFKTETGSQSLEFADRQIVIPANRTLTPDDIVRQEAGAPVESIVRLPKVLTLHLKIFQFDNSQITKDTRKVNIPFELDLSSVGSSVTYTPESVYNLFAVVSHIGETPTNGHYIVYIKDENSWVKCNDTDIMVVKEDSVFDPNNADSPYLLFYTCRMGAEEQGFIKSSTLRLSRVRHTDTTHICPTDGLFNIRLQDKIQGRSERIRSASPTRQSRVKPVACGPTKKEKNTPPVFTAKQEQRTSARFEIPQKSFGAYTTLAGLKSVLFAHDDTAQNSMATCCKTISHLNRFLTEVLQCGVLLEAAVVALFGDQSSGKSTLINNLIGAKVCHTATSTATVARMILQCLLGEETNGETLCDVSYRDQRERVKARELPSVYRKWFPREPEKAPEIRMEPVNVTSHTSAENLPHLVADHVGFTTAGPIQRGAVTLATMTVKEYISPRLNDAAVPDALLCIHAGSSLIAGNQIWNNVPLWKECGKSLKVVVTKMDTISIDEIAKSILEANQNHTCSLTPLGILDFIQNLILDSNYTDETGRQVKSLPNDIQFYWTAFGDPTIPEGASEKQCRELMKEAELKAVEKAVELLTSDSWKQHFSAFNVPFGEPDKLREKLSSKRLFDSLKANQRKLAEQTLTRVIDAFAIASNTATQSYHGHISKRFHSSNQSIKFLQDVIATFYMLQVPNPPHAWDLPKNVKKVQERMASKTLGYTEAEERAFADQVRRDCTGAIQKFPDAADEEVDQIIVRCNPEHAVEKHFSVSRILRRFMKRLLAMFVLLDDPQLDANEAQRLIQQVGGKVMDVHGSLVEQAATRYIELYELLTNNFCYRTAFSVLLAANVAFETVLAVDDKASELLELPPNAGLPDLVKCAVKFSKILNVNVKAQVNGQRTPESSVIDFISAVPLKGVVEKAIAMGTITQSKPRVLLSRVLVRLYFDDIYKGVAEQCAMFKGPLLETLNYKYISLNQYLQVTMQEDRDFILKCIGGSGELVNEVIGELRGAISSIENGKNLANQNVNDQKFTQKFKKDNESMIIRNIICKPKISKREQAQHVVLLTEMNASHGITQRMEFSITNSDSDEQLRSMNHVFKEVTHMAKVETLKELWKVSEQYTGVLFTKTEHQLSAQSKALDCLISLLLDYEYPYTLEERKALRDDHLDPDWILPFTYEHRERLRETNNPDVFDTVYIPGSLARCYESPLFNTCIEKIRKGDVEYAEFLSLYKKWEDQRFSGLCDPEHDVYCKELAKMLGDSCYAVFDENHSGTMENTHLKRNAENWRFVLKGLTAVRDWLKSNASEALKIEKDVLVHPIDRQAQKRMNQEDPWSNKSS